MKKIVRTQIRYPLFLRVWLQKIAERNSRSMNGELVQIMKEAKAVDESQLGKATNG